MTLIGMTPAVGRMGSVANLWLAHEQPAEPRHARRVAGTHGHVVWDAPMTRHAEYFNRPDDTGYQREPFVISHLLLGFPSTDVGFRHARSVPGTWFTFHFGRDG